MLPPALRYRFKSYQEFEAFDGALTQQLAAGQWVAVDQPLVAEPRLFPQPDAYYQLAATQEIWALSSPDNAWRGYFLPLTEALAYQRRLAGTDKQAGVGGCLLLLLAGALTAWLLLR